jgi:protein-disulfide isomerase
MTVEANQPQDRARQIPLAEQTIGAPLERLAVPVTPGDHALGAIEPSVTLVEYGEFECPHCGRAHFQLKAVRERFSELNACFVFRHFARDEVHPFSVRAAVAAEAAGAQGRFWEMHDHLFENQHSLEYEDLERHAVAVRLDVERFLRDLVDPRHLERVNAHRDGAIESGVTSTPTFFLNGERYDGRYDANTLIDAISRETGVLRID